MDHHNEAIHRLEWQLGLSTTPPEAPDPGGPFPTVGGPAWAEPLSMTTSGGMSFDFEPAAMPPPPPHRDPAQVPYDATLYQPAVGVAKPHSLNRQCTAVGRTQHDVNYAPPAPSMAVPSEANGGADDDRVRENRASRQEAGGRRNQRKPRMKPPPESEWKARQEVIRTLYMERKLSLAETMEHMETIFNFKASEKMYKQMFKKWQWSKYLPKDKATWMAKRADELGPKNIEFRWGNQVWTTDKILKTRAPTRTPREPEEEVNKDNPTPSDISYGTPRNPGSNAENAQHACQNGNDGQRMAESARTRIFQALNTGPVYLDPKKITLDDLRALTQAAWEANSAGQLLDAESQLQDALCGFSRLLSPTHEEALKAGYHLACFYADHGRMDEADETLNWMTERHRARHGVNDEKSLRHLTRVVDLLQSWTRVEHASLLAYRILNSIDDLEHLDTNVLPRNHCKGHLPNIHGGDIVDRIAALDNDVGNIDAYLRFLRNFAGKGQNLPLLREILPALMRHCDAAPETLSMQRVESSCLLAEMEIESGDHRAARAALASSDAAFEALLSQDEEVPEPVRTLGRRLAFSFLDAQDSATCERLLEMMAESIESRAGIEEDEDADALAISFLVSVGGEYHMRTCWKQCRPWIERSLALSILVFGPRHPESKRLTQMLEAEEFKGNGFRRVEDLIKFSGRLFRFKIA